MAIDTGSLNTIDAFMLSDTDFRALVGSEPIAMLLGSGISHWSPTGLPTGKEFVSAVRDALFKAPALPPIADPGAHGGPDSVLAQLTQMPFEVLLDAYPDQPALRRIISNLYITERPNDIHWALAALLERGQAACLITTNYDTGLDIALDAPVTSERVTRIRCEAEAPTDPSELRHTPVYFKIHGTAEAGFEESLMFALQDEAAALEWEWRGAPLRALVRGRVLLVLGYSGWDFDVCGAIPSARPARVIWNFRTRSDMDQSPGLQTMLEAGVQVHCVIGDMQNVFRLLDAPVVNMKEGPNAAAGVVAQLSQLEAKDMLIWRARLLNRASHANWALQSIPAGRCTRKTDPDGTALVERGHALQRAGRYRTSADAYETAAERAPSDYARRMRLLDASDVLRSFGSRRRARRNLSRAAEGVPLEVNKPTREGRELLARILLKRFLLTRDRFVTISKLCDFSKRGSLFAVAFAGLATGILLFLHRFAPSGLVTATWVGAVAVAVGTMLLAVTERFLRRELKQILARGVRAADEAGFRHDWQQFALYAASVDISIPVSTVSSRPGPPPSSRGYAHLGDSLAVGMAALDALRKSERHRPPEPAVRAAIASFDLARERGCHALAWKLASTLARRDRAQRPRWNRLAKEHRAQCEYTLVQRLSLIRHWSA